MRPGLGTRLSGVGSEYNAECRCQQLAVPDQLAAASQVLGGDQIWVAPGGPVPHDPLHAWPERGEHGLLFGVKPGGLQTVQEAQQLRDRPLVASRAARIHQRCVAVSEPEHEPVAEPVQGLPVLADNAGRVVHPDVEDPGGDNQLLSHLEQFAGYAERVAAGIRYPHRLVAELLQFPHGIPAGGSVDVVPQFAAPDAYAGDPLDRWCGHDITPPAWAAGGW